MSVSIILRNTVTSTLLGAVVFVLLQAVVVLCGFPATLTMERAFPMNHRIELSQLRDRDSLRHRRILQKHTSPRGFIEFHVQGTYDPSDAGLYFTKVKLGSPPKEYYVQIDTGSHVLWVSCKPCNGCPTSSELEIPITFYDPSSSSTSSPVSCSDQICSQAGRSNESSCSHNHCNYTLHYGDGSATSGHYVSDLMHFETIFTNKESLNTSASVVFGCSTSETGILTTSDRVVDGILGFGQQGLSIMSQLSSQGIAPNSFSHCLAAGGGRLVIGQPMVRDMVFTPLVNSTGYYSINLLSISVNGKTLSIDPSVFAINDKQEGTIIDSGTTLGYLTQEAYTPFVDAITLSVLPSVHPYTKDGNPCYSITSNVSHIFPTVKLNFAGGASMHLRPQDYLLQQISMGVEGWCMGFQRSPKEGFTVLGDLVLKDKIIVYDLDGQRIGWADYDCFSIVDVSANSSGGSSEVVNATLIGGGSSLRITYPVIVIASILHLAMMIIGLHPLQPSISLEFM